MYQLDGKVAFVTGGALGIGRRIATRLAREGCDLALLDVNIEEAEKTAALVRDAGRRAEVAKVDVGDFHQAKGAIDGLAVTFGRLDILVNNAGIVHLSAVIDTDPKDWRNVFRVNADGVFNCCKAGLPHMIARKAGKVINIASWFGKLGKPGYSAYCASKAAVIALTQSLALEMAPVGINVNAVCPGAIVDTAMRDAADREAVKLGLLTARQREHTIPMGRVGLPEDIARVVAFLASDESAYMTGQAINVTGGLWMH